MPTLPALLMGFTLGSPPAEPPGIVQPVHGCHQTWQRSGRGLHRHGPECDLREGLADRQKSKKSKPKAHTAVYSGVRLTRRITGLFEEVPAFVGAEQGAD